MLRLYVMISDEAELLVADKQDTVEDTDLTTAEISDPVTGPDPTPKPREPEPASSEFEPAPPEPELPFEADAQDTEMMVIRPPLWKWQPLESRKKPWGRRIDNVKLSAALEAGQRDFTISELESFGMTAENMEDDFCFIHAGGVWYELDVDLSLIHI